MAWTFSGGLICTFFAMQVVFLLIFVNQPSGTSIKRPPAQPPKSKLSPEEPIVDVVSIGTLKRPELQESQRQSMGGYVRNMFFINEKNDTDATCYTNLTSTQVFSVSEKCFHLDPEVVRTQAPVLADMATKFMPPSFFKRIMKKGDDVPAGWLCAQKRPVDALWKVLQTYSLDDPSSIPDYLMVMDDDTWINMPVFRSDLLETYDPKVPRVIAGCNYVFVEQNRSFPFGGYGVTFTRAAIERWLTPLDNCLLPYQEHSLSKEDRRHQRDLDDGKMDSFVQHACRTVASFHGIGEKLEAAREVRRSLGEESGSEDESPTVADILWAYSQRVRYADIDVGWDDIGYCFHSDWILAYFAEEYHITRDGHVDAYQGSRKIPPHDLTGQCVHEEAALCYENATICHYMTAEHMQARMHV